MSAKEVMTFKPGDRVEYKITDDRWLPGVVVSITKRRIWVRLDMHPNSRRYTLANQLRHAEDEAAG